MVRNSTLTLQILNNKKHTFRGRSFCLSATPPSHTGDNDSSITTTVFAVLTCSLIFLHCKHWKHAIFSTRASTRFVPSTKSISLIFKSLIGSMRGCRLLLVATILGCQSYARFNSSWVTKIVDCDGESSLFE